MKNENYVTLASGEKIPYYQIDNDVNGNPRFVVHFVNLGVHHSDYGNIKGLTKYRAKWFGGGYVFSSYNVKEDLEYMIEIVENYYN